MEFSIGTSIFNIYTGKGGFSLYMYLYVYYYNMTDKAIG